MKPFYAIFFGFLTLLISLILSVLIISNQPVGYWYYMTYSQRMWFSICTSSLIFIWCLAIVVICTLFVKAIDYKG